MQSIPQIGRKPNQRSAQAIWLGALRGMTTKKARLTEGQIIGILQEHEAGRNAGIPAASAGCLTASSMPGKAKHSGMTVSDAKRLKASEDENTRLKRLLAGQMHDMALACPDRVIRFES